MECADVPLLTPSSKEMMSQALKATFSGFAKEQQRLGIPKGKTRLPDEQLWQTEIVSACQDALPHICHPFDWFPLCSIAWFIGSISWKNPDIEAKPFSTACKL